MSIEIVDELFKLGLADEVVWFAFRELCDGPRSQNDYIEIANAIRRFSLMGFQF